MSKFTPSEEASLKVITEELWKVSEPCTHWFPTDFSDFIQKHSRIYGCPEMYLGIPLIVTASHLSMHTTVWVDKYHQEPTVIYGLVGGGSGSNKSAALRMFTDMIDRIRGPIKFDTGTNDGLMLALQQNSRAIASMNDEFATFVNNLEQTSGGVDKCRVLSLFNATTWSKYTKTNGIIMVEDPRFNLLGFSQSHNVIDFAQKNLSDGLFQRFLCGVPEEVYVYRKEIKEEIANAVSTINLEEILKILFQFCSTKDVVIRLSEDAENAYDEFYDETVDFRRENSSASDEISVISKARGLSLRLAGIICLLRTSLDKFAKKNINEVSTSMLEETSLQPSQCTMSSTSNQPLPNSTPVNDDEDPIITKEDYKMALNIVRYSVKVAKIIINKKHDNAATTKQKQKAVSSKARQEQIPVPEPSEITMEYLLCNHVHVKNLLCKEDSTRISDITRLKTYPNQCGGRIPAVKFVRGLELNGLGKYSPGSDCFKRYNPEDDNCPDREGVKRKWQRLNFN